MWKLEIKERGGKYEVTVNGEDIGEIRKDRNGFPFLYLIDDWKDEISLSTMKDIIDTWGKEFCDVYGHSLDFKYI